MHQSHRLEQPPPLPLSYPQSRTGSLLQQQHPSSPHPPQQPPPVLFPSSHQTAQSFAQQQQSYSQTGPASTANQTPGTQYYTSQPNPYQTTGAPGAYSNQENPEMMAATHMNRPYPPIYHTPQSNSPASVASSSGHDPHGRGLYGQPPPQLPQSMYGYQPYPSMPQPTSSPYGQPPQTPQHSLSSQQPLLMSHQPSQPQMQHQTPHSAPAMKTSPRSQFSQTPVLDQKPNGPLAPAHQIQSAQSTPHMTPNHQQSPNAAPGPIPATTPLVVRQDNNGVQWIAFEYSRDRVKMEYTIRCDVESVNVDSLSQEFKTENCVYPRACCNKDQYTGNRLIYETECNTVGWSLAELNPCLRGKRGLIQRAVDSWRNSNQDPRLRSRRVRRMAKMNNRKAHMTPGVVPNPNAPVSAGLPPAPTPGAVRPSVGGQANMTGPVDPSYAAHQASTRPAVSQSYHTPIDPVSSILSKPGSDIRPANVFHPLPSYAATLNSSSLSAAPPLTMPPHLPDAFDPLRQSHRSSIVSAAPVRRDPANPSDAELDELFSTIPESKRRKFILVDDPARCSRVRVRVMLENVDVREIPDSYRKANSVYPRSYVPTQFSAETPPLSPGTAAAAADGSSSTETRTWVPAPTSDGEVTVPIPRRPAARKRKEGVLNELGLRMSWSQSRVFAGRGLFLQRALDAYRSKMHHSLVSVDDGARDIRGGGRVVEIGGRSAEDAAETYFETRRGKRSWTELLDRRAGRASNKRRRIDSRDEDGRA